MTTEGVDLVEDTELNDADRARIEYLSRGQLSEDEAERIVRFAKLDRDARNPVMLTSPSDGAQGTSDDEVSSKGNATKNVGADTCDAIRRTMRDANRASTVVDKFDALHPSTVFRHAEGRCACNGSEEPTTSPRVRPDECDDMRDAFRSGATKRDVMSDFARSSNTVYKHLFGDCDNERDRTDGNISTEECGHLRATYRRNDVITGTDLAVAFGVGKSTCYWHLRGSCDHDVDVDPVGPKDTDEDECVAMRQTFEAEGNVAAVARSFDVSRPTADYHIFGKCACDNHDRQPPADRSKR